MKTSKIIFTSYFSLIGILLIALMISSFINNDKEKISRLNLVTTSDELTAFNHIKIETNCNIVVSSDTTYHFEFTRNKKEGNLKINYTYNSDTLIIGHIETEQFSNIKIYAKNITSISTIKSKLSLTHFQQDSLQINAQRGRIRFENKIDINNLKLKLREGSNFNAWTCKINTIDLYCRNSNFNTSLKKKLKLFKGDISEKSNIKIPKAFKYDINADELSQLRMY
ncbi:hypothetical protein [Labilibacter marinus]|uniref:hypothetical protein n=1 Tax=Labilibacter marinus TaxID=1477105 RepID=UPI00094FD1C3|nr:hypothetical protein [Labilibacter marinus]